MRNIFTYLGLLAFMHTGSFAWGQLAYSDSILNAQQAAIQDLARERQGLRIRQIPAAVHNAQVAFVKGDPYLEGRDWKIGSVKTRDDYYPALLLNYDIYTDALVYAPNTESILRLRIPPSQVRSFKLENRLFVRLPLDSFQLDPKATKLRLGYLEQLYEGRLGLYSKVEKRIIKGNAGANGRFELKRFWIVRQETQLIKLKSKGQILELMVDQKTAIKAYWKQHRLSLRLSESQEIADLFAYYDSLGS